MKCKIALETKIFVWFILGVMAMIPVMGLCQSTPLKALEPNNLPAINSNVNSNDTILSSIQDTLNLIAEHTAPKIFLGEESTKINSWVGLLAMVFGFLAMVFGFGGFLYQKLSSDSLKKIRPNKIPYLIIAEKLYNNLLILNVLNEIEHSDSPEEVKRKRREGYRIDKLLEEMRMPDDLINISCYEKYNDNSIYERVYSIIFKWREFNALINETKKQYNNQDIEKMLYSYELLLQEFTSIYKQWNSLEDSTKKISLLKARKKLSTHYVSSSVVITEKIYSNHLRSNPKLEEYVSALDLAENRLSLHPEMASGIKKGHAHIKCAIETNIPSRDLLDPRISINLCGLLDDSYSFPLISKEFRKRLNENRLFRTIRMPRSFKGLWLYYTKVGRKGIIYKQKFFLFYNLLCDFYTDYIKGNENGWAAFRHGSKATVPDQLYLEWLCAYLSDEFTGDCFNAGFFNSVIEAMDTAKKRESLILGNAEFYSEEKGYFENIRKHYCEFDFFYADYYHKGNYVLSLYNLLSSIVAEQTISISATYLCRWKYGIYGELAYFKGNNMRPILRKLQILDSDNKLIKTREELDLCIKEMPKELLFESLTDYGYIDKFIKWSKEKLNCYPFEIEVINSIFIESEY